HVRPTRHKRQNILALKVLPHPHTEIRGRLNLDQRSAFVGDLRIEAVSTGCEESYVIGAIRVVLDFEGLDPKFSSKILQGRFNRSNRCSCIKGHWNGDERRPLSDVGSFW